MKIAIIIGTRPEIIKMAPIIRACQKSKIDFFILHTNQHYSENLDKIFFDELELPHPKYNLGIGSGTHAETTAKMMIGIERILIDEKPNIVLVQGDTNTVLAGVLAATKIHIKIGHIEAGLRSYFRQMPEEINRIIADQCADFLFTPTQNAKKILINEGISSKKIITTGNTIVDAVMQNIELSKKKSKILNKLGIQKNKYLLLTIHREENVDNRERLENFFASLKLIIKEYNQSIVYPIHPRTKKMIDLFNIEVPQGIMVIEPVGFIDFLQLEINSNLILTDSGGVQEEACILKVPCVTLRDNTERPETVTVGANILAGADVKNIMKCVSKMINKKRSWNNPFGNGRASEKIISVLSKINDSMK